MKSKVAKLDVDKLVAVPVDLSKLSDAVKSNVVKKTENDELVKKVYTFKTTDTSNLVTKTDCNTKINEIGKKITDYDHDKYITTQEFNKLTAEDITARLAQANLAGKNDIAGLLKKTDFIDKLKNINKKVTKNKIKHAETEKQN